MPNISKLSVDKILVDARSISYSAIQSNSKKYPKCEYVKTAIKN